VGGYRVLLRQDNAREMVVVHVINELDGENGNVLKRWALRYENGYALWEEVAEGAEIPATYQLSGHIAQLLTDELNKMYEPLEHVHPLQQQLTLTLNRLDALMDKLEAPNGDA
jgi:hypothetical protein